MPTDTPFDIKAESDIIQAAASGDMKTLLEKITTNNVDLRASNGSTPLMFAAESGHLDAVKYLIKMGANVTLKNNEGWTTFGFALVAGQLEVIYYLLTEGGIFLYEIKKQLVGKSIRNIIILAMKMRHFNLAQYLLNHGDVDIQEKDDDANALTFLMWSILFDSIDIVAHLIQRGAFINDTSATGSTALIVASAFYRPEIIKYLLAQGANLEIKNMDGFTALSLWSIPDALVENKNECLSILTSAEQLMDLARNKTSIPLETASNNLEKLLTAGASVHQRGKGNQTPLHLAAGCGNAVLFSLLLEHNANPDAKDDCNLTPAQLAKDNGYPEFEVLVLIHQDKTLSECEHSRKYSEERLKIIEDCCFGITDPDKKFEAFFLLGKHALEHALPGLVYRAFSHIEIGKDNKAQYKEAQLCIAELYIARKISLEGNDIQQSLEFDIKETIEQKQAYVEKALYHLAHAGMSKETIRLRTGLINDYFNTPSVVNLDAEYGDPYNRDSLLKLFDKHHKLKNERDEKQKEIDFLKKQLAAKDIELETYKVKNNFPFNQLS